MPIYEYKCRKCGDIFERICFAGDDEKNIGCPNCEEKDVERVLSCFSSVSSGSGTGSSLGSSGCAPSGGFS